jgi:hypothetical protein
MAPVDCDDLTAARRVLDEPRSLAVLGSNYRPLKRKAGARPRGADVYANETPKWKACGKAGVSEPPPDPSKVSREQRFE